MKTCYYAHGVHLFDTMVEQEDVWYLQDLGFTVINPNEKKHKFYYHLMGMEYYKPIIHGCQVLAFRSFPDGKIGAGVAQEIEWAYKGNIPIIEILNRVSSERYLSIEATKKRIAL